MTTPELAVGQIWADNDPRETGRFLRITALEGPPRYEVLHAHCERVAHRGGSFSVSGRKTTIRADRFRSTKTGYRLIEEPE